MPRLVVMRSVAATVNVALLCFLGYLMLKYDGPWRVQETIVVVATVVPIVVALVAMSVSHPAPSLRKLAGALAGVMIVLGVWVLAIGRNAMSMVELVWAVLHFTAPASTMLALGFLSTSNPANGSPPN